MASSSPTTKDRLRARPLLIGVVHLAPLPGSPAGKSRGRPWLDRALVDARALWRAGFHGVIVENYGDAPFFKDRVPAETVAAMTVVAGAVRDALPPKIAVGVNVLRNDGRAALAVAAACELDFLRVNVLAGAVVTDQGVIEGDAAALLRLRARLAPAVRIFADVRVKHAAPIAERPLAEEARDLVRRAKADALIVTGSRTGSAVDPVELRTVRKAAGGTPVLIGSGASAATVAHLLEGADGVIVGSSLKRGGRTGSPVDAARARAFVRAVRP